YGLLQPLADGLKLLVKESVLPSQANKGLFYLAPFITLTLSLLGWIPIPFAKASPLADMSLGLLYLMALSSLGVYGVLLAGWSANSKYAFIGSLRSTAQLVSYELPFALLILIVVIIPGSLSLSHIIEAQEPVWYLVPLLPIWVLWVMVVVAETNRAPFDLPESESELVAGFFTEHSALPFAYFFLAEYGSMILISVLSSILFLGGYLLPGGISTSPVLESLPNGLLCQHPADYETDEIVNLAGGWASSGGYLRGALPKYQAIGRPIAQHGNTLNDGFERIPVTALWGTSRLGFRTVGVQLRQGGIGVKRSAISEGRSLMFLPSFRIYQSYGVQSSRIPASLIKDVSRVAPTMPRYSKRPKRWKTNSLSFWLILRRASFALISKLPGDP
ncbi:785_t:CDS:2, partial [Dentiscutata heterogama]